MTRGTLISLVMSAALALAAFEMGHRNTVTLRAFVRRYEITRRAYRRTMHLHERINALRMH